MRIAVIAALLCVPLSTVAEEPWKGKDLQVLLKDITKDKIKEVMKKQAEALGVDCDFCHNVPNMSENIKKKDVARRMIRMVEDINGHFFQGKPKVQCVTCHRGEHEPKI